MTNPLARYDAFDDISNETLLESYYEAIRDNDDEDAYLIALELTRRGLLGVS